ncbi:Membrane protein involved in the export of O-antigen and teichoic acid [Polaromonas sp. YR568]|uniref:flippase n=1 Tax=Polaromonas sp. YR568 TaxID=1855301 RepID=UPI0008E5E0A0|nr:flippase [Polaromonas sp. YR568]SFU91740.1 Membrane protein involved in the export of O-antigen and teichoic acid [Polaromonas sp. YR568]
MLTNTAWNLAGLGAPILAAVVAMPLLISQLGDARFGILALGWMVTGYFALFDFGVGRATTRSMAALRNTAAEGDHASVFWNSLYVHAALASLGGVIFAAAVPWLVDIAFAIPPALRDEAYAAFYWLAFSVPALVLASALRGPLEAEQRFDLVNAVKMPISALNYLAPLLALQFTHRIDAVIAVIALSRWLATLAYGELCRRAVRLQPGHRAPRWSTITDLLKDGGWLTVTSIAVPVIMMLDRSLIARLVSLEAVTYYVVPYEVVTKMWILSASLLGAAYPLMSASKGQDLRQLCDQALRWLLVTATPATLTVVIFADDLLRLWVGPHIAAHGAAVMQWLAIGVWINILAQVPLTALQASGRANIVGSVQLLELPFYAVLAWCLILRHGAAGAAAAWTIRATIEWAVLSFSLHRTEAHPGRWPGISVPRFILLSATIMAGGLAAYATPFAVKCLLALVLIAGQAAWQWRYLLTAQERGKLLARISRQTATK